MATFALGSSTFTIPNGWQEIQKDEERLIFAVSDGSLRATVSLMRFNTALSLDLFKRICSLRYEAEKKGLTEVHLEPETPVPFEAGSRKGMFFSGAEKKAGRIFSGLLNLEGKELITIYVEGIQIDPQSHLEAFNVFTSSLNRRQ